MAEKKDTKIVVENSDDCRLDHRYCQIIHNADCSKEKGRVLPKRCPLLLGDVVVSMKKD